MIKEDNWYVITTRPRAEKKVSAGLTKMGIHHFLPVQKQLRQWKDRKKWVDTVLFNAYIFVQTKEQFRNEVFAVPGVIKYLATDGKPCMVAGDEIERIKRICRYESELITSQEQFITGDEVEITGGPLMGLYGKLIEKENTVYLSILIEKIGYSVSFKVDRSLVQKRRK